MNLNVIASRISSDMASDACRANPTRFIQECQIALNKYIEYNDIEPIKIIGAGVLSATGEIGLSLEGGDLGPAQWESNLEDQKYDQFMNDVGPFVLNAKLAYDEGPF
jgi:hypothetical protein